MKFLVLLFSILFSGCAFAAGPCYWGSGGRTICVQAELRVDGSGGMLLDDDAVTVLEATNGTNGDAGKLILAPNNDSTVTNGGALQGDTDGNIRGINATDWQRQRAAASQVASANRSTIGGGDNNTASGLAAVVAGGSANTATSTTSVIAGGQSNSTTGGFANTVGGGLGNNAAATGATVPGGEYNIAAGADSLAGGRAARANTAGDFSWGYNAAISAPAATATNVHFRIAGDTANIEVGRTTNQAAVAGHTNELRLQTTNASNQSSFIAHKAAALTASSTYTWPNDGAAGAVLQTSGAGVLSWGTYARVVGTPAASGSCSATCTGSRKAFGGRCEHTAALSLQNAGVDSDTTYSCLYLTYISGNCTATVTCL